MENKQNYNELVIKDKVEEVMKKAQDILFRMFGDSSIVPEDIWGANNYLEVNELPILFNQLKDNGFLNTSLILHYTKDSSGTSYEEMETKYILMDSCKPVYVEEFDHFFDAPQGVWGHCGVLKDGFRDLLKAIFLYEEYKITSIKESK